MTSKGQITIPAATRAKLRLVSGSKFEVVENDRGEIVLRPKTGDIRRLYGFFNYDGPPVTIDEMDEAIGRAVTEEYLRSIE